MKEINRNSIVFCSFFLVIFLILSSSAVSAARSDVEAFVTRFYQQCLGRGPDPTGLNGWANGLLTGVGTGADVAYGFVFSNEFQNMNKTDQEYLYVLYSAFFNRGPDPPGYNGWMTVLASWTPLYGQWTARKQVLDGFLGSLEFMNLCNSYGISPYSTNTTPDSPNIVLSGTINRTTDYSGDIMLLGELKNTGGKAASFVEINFTFYDTSLNVIGTDSTYVYGSCLTIALTNSETATCLQQNEIGAFQLNTSISNTSVYTYNSSISFNTYDLTTPDANMVVTSNITEQQGYFNYLQLLGTVQNIGSMGLIFGEICFAIKNSSGKIIDTDCTYIDGDNVLISSINSYTDTALRPGSTGTFDITTSADFDQYSSYYYKTSWRDRKIENNIAYSRSRRSINLNEIAGLQFQSEEERQNYRKKQIEEQKRLIESLLN